MKRNGYQTAMVGKHQPFLSQYEPTDGWTDKHIEGNFK